MSVSEASSGIQAASSATVGAVSDSEKTDKTVLQTIKEKFAAGKNYVLAHKGTFANIGQIGGTAALITGGASLLFSGIAANLTIAGTPLGIPLMVAGGIMLAAGTILQVAHHIEKEGSSVGEKIKGFFKDTFNNIKLGMIAGVGISCAFAIVSLAKMMVVIPVLIKLKPLLSKNPNNEKNWKALIDSLPDDSKLKKTLQGSTSLDDFLDKYTKPVKGIVEHLEKSDKKGDVPSADKTEESAQEHEDLAASLALNIELPKVAERGN